MTPEEKQKQDVLEQMARWRNDVALFAFELFGFVPDLWQSEVFGHWNAAAQRIAMQACKGPGKTAVLAILIWHFIATRPFPKVACTSISGDNLADCLWTELATWQQKSPLLLRVFEWTKTRIECRDHRETWWASARTWSRTANAETLGQTLAGLHGDYLLFVLDETGAMPEAIMAAAEAALSTGVEVRMVQAGNPLQCEGPLWTAARRDRANWKIVEITGDPDDPRRSPRISVEWARQQIQSHGADNPWVLANVFGRFPGASPMSFIGEDLVTGAQQREALAQISDPLVMGVDVARFGNDKTVIRMRKGRDARTHPPVKLRNLDNFQVATRVAQLAVDNQVDAIFVDGGGNGGGVIDILRAVLHVKNVIEVQFGAKADRVSVNPGDPQGAIAYGNKAAEMYGELKAWLRGGAIDSDHDLMVDLTARRYGFTMIQGRSCIVLEPKDAMKLRGFDSPDDGDALALTFAYPVQPHARSGFAGAAQIRGNANMALTEYDPFNNPVAAAALAQGIDYDPHR